MTDKRTERRVVLGAILITAVLWLVALGADEVQVAQAGWLNQTIPTATPSGGPDKPPTREPTDRPPEGTDVPPRPTDTVAPGATALPTTAVPTPGSTTEPGATASAPAPSPSATSPGTVLAPTGTALVVTLTPDPGLPTLTPPAAAVMPTLAGPAAAGPGVTLTAEMAASESVAVETATPRAMPTPIRADLSVTGGRRLLDWSCVWVAAGLLLIILGAVLLVRRTQTT